MDRAKEKSANFADQDVSSNQAHLFFKLHFLTDSNRLVTLSMVDLAGHPDGKSNDGFAVPGTSPSHEINNSLNYLLFIFKDLMYSGKSLHKNSKAIQDISALKGPKLNKSSLILKEFNKLFALGQFKPSFLHLGTDDVDQKSKYDKFIDQTVKQIRIPVIKAKPVESLSDLEVKNLISF